MLDAIRKRLDRDEEGFTLIELMVVVLIIAILIAIAIPTFLGARSRAQDRAAQSGLRNALTNAKAIYTDNSDYSGVTEAAMDAAEPSLDFLTNAGDDSTGPKVISFSASGQTFSAAALSDSGKCFWIKDTSGSTTYGTGATCDGTAALGAASAKW